MIYEPCDAGDKDSPSGTDTRLLPDGDGPSGEASVQPQLLDGRMAWPPAKRNVYTNTHNCSVRSHGELTILRRRGLSSCCVVFSARQVLQGGGKRRGGQDGA